MTIETQVKSILYTKFFVDPKDNKATLIGDLNMDSLDLIELTMELEREFNITIPESVWDNYAPMTVAGLIDVVEKAGGVADPKFDAPDFLRESQSTQEQKHTPVQHNTAKSEVAPVQKPFNGLYTTSANGKAKCRLTGRPCQKITPDELAKNTQSLNLCRQYKCIIEKNFQDIMQEHTK